MDVSGALHTLRKHWILTSVLVLLTLIAAMGAWAKISGPYQSASQVVFLASQQTSKPNGNNPYLSFDDMLSTTADIVRREVLDPRIVAALAARGFGDLRHPE
jgi:capsular polysaccharide biosynthesis protein